MSNIDVKGKNVAENQQCTIWYKELSLGMTYEIWKIEGQKIFQKMEMASFIPLSIS